MEALAVEFTYELRRLLADALGAERRLARLLPTLSDAERDQLIGRVREAVEPFRRPTAATASPAGRCVAATR